MCAVGICARELQIWKEVNGIFTADPIKIPTAKLLSTVTSEEVVELTYFGSEACDILSPQLTLLYGTILCPSACPEPLD